MQITTKAYTSRPTSCGLASTSFLFEIYVIDGQRFIDVLVNGAEFCLRVSLSEAKQAIQNATPRLTVKRGATRALYAAVHAAIPASLHR